MVEWPWSSSLAPRRAGIPVVGLPQVLAGPEIPLKTLSQENEINV